MKFLGLHIVGVGAERFVFPGGIPRLRIGFSSASELGKMVVGDALFLQRLRKSLAVKVRVLVGTRHAANVGKKLNGMRLKNVREVFHRFVGMTDRPNYGFESHGGMNSI
jgi:hypothetical protein